MLDRVIGVLDQLLHVHGQLGHGLRLLQKLRLAPAPSQSHQAEYAGQQDQERRVAEYKEVRGVPQYPLRARTRVLYSALGLEVEVIVGPEQPRKIRQGQRLESVDFLQLVLVKDFHEQFRRVVCG